MTTCWCSARATPLVAPRSPRLCATPPYSPVNTNRTVYSLMARAPKGSKQLRPAAVASPLPAAGLKSAPPLRKYNTYPGAALPDFMQRARRWAGSLWATIPRLRHDGGRGVRAHGGYRSGEGRSGLNTRRKQNNERQEVDVHPVRVCL